MSNIEIINKYFWGKRMQCSLSLSLSKHLGPEPVIIISWLSWHKAKKLIILHEDKMDGFSPIPLFEI